MKRVMVILFCLLLLPAIIKVCAEPPSPPRTSIGVKGGEMVCVPGGEFIMGSDSGYDDEKPVHRVYLDKYFINK